jgi:hypothetical protein
MNVATPLLLIEVVTATPSGAIWGSPAGQHVGGSGAPATENGKSAVGSQLGGNDAEKFALTLTVQAPLVSGSGTVAAVPLDKVHAPELVLAWVVTAFVFNLNT